MFDEDCLAYFSFQKITQQFLSRSAVSSQCQKALEIVKKRNNHVFTHVHSLEPHLRLWFKTLFLSVFGPEKIVGVFDKWFSVAQNDRSTFLCCLAVALLELNIKKEDKSLGKLNQLSNSVLEVVKHTSEILGSLK